MYNTKIRLKVNCKIMLLKRTEENGIIEALYESSNILSSKYDGKDLTIVFKRGASYTYNDVSRSDYTRFEMADSQGVVMNKYIKQYSFTKNDVVNEDVIVKEITEAKEAEVTAFEGGLISQMKTMVDAFDANERLDGKQLAKLTEMIIKYNDLAGASSSLKLCACD